MRSAFVFVLVLPALAAVDQSLLEKGSRYLLDNKRASSSLLVLRGGEIVFERYYGGATRDTAGNIKSINKSFLSALTGIAIAEGRIHGLDDRVDAYVPGAGELRIWHLLTMTAGLSWTENGSVTREWYTSPDPNRFALSQRRLAPPGETFQYSTALAHLLSTVLTRATGQSTLDYARSRLFEPLGISCPRWDQLKGVYFGGAEFYITARDLARFGQAYLQKGRWNGRQVIPAEWVEVSTSPQVRNIYGYMWWLYKVDKHNMACAGGAFGQYLCLIPDLDVVVVHTSREAESREAAIVPLETIRRFVIPACLTRRE